MPTKPRLYLDHAATTPVVPAAREAMTEALGRWANPSSPHAEGRAARAALENARARIADRLGWDGEVIFTSGASEAIAIASRGRPVVASAVEHDAVLAHAVQKRLAVNALGQVILSGIDGPERYAVQSVNNETGVIQSLSEVASTVRSKGGSLLADCSQSVGKMPLPDADLIAISAHKFGGPPGIGALLARNLGMLEPTGGQEQGYRRGTENLPAVIAMAAALDATDDWLSETNRLRDLLDAAILSKGGEVVAFGALRLPTISSYRMPGVSASSQLISFDMAGIAVSAGSACSSGTLKSSHVLGAMGWESAAAGEVVRVSFGPGTSEPDIGRFVETWCAISTRTRNT